MNQQKLGTALRAGATVVAVLILVLLQPAGCTIEQQCQETRDCTDGMLCEVGTGTCVYECEVDADCGGFGFHCEDHVCAFECEDAVLTCPEGMASICGAYCIDRYEASRPDATVEFAGIDDSMALSQAAVIPWHSGVLTIVEAEAACVAAGKRLCSPQEWEVVCAGLDQRTYVYGDQYDPRTCNSIDTYCDEDCGVYPDCYHDCDYDHRIMPTGSFSDCVNDFGVFDLSGNTWEAVDYGDGVNHFRGGAFDCGDPALAHTCGYDGVAAGTFPTTRGFRCCSDGETSR